MREKIAKKINQSPAHTDAALLLFLCAQLAHLRRRGRIVGTRGCPADENSLRSEAATIRGQFERFQVVVKVKGKHDSVELGAPFSFLELTFKCDQNTGKLNTTQIKQVLAPQLVAALVDELRYPSTNPVLAALVDPPETPAAGEEWRVLEYTRGLEVIGDQNRAEYRQVLVKLCFDILTALHKLGTDAAAVEAGEAEAVSWIPKERLQAQAQTLVANRGIVLGGGNAGALRLRLIEPLVSRDGIPDIRLVLVEHLPGTLSRYPNFVDRARAYLNSRKIHGLGYLSYVLNADSHAQVLATFPPKFAKVFAHHVTHSVFVPEDTPLPAEARNIQVIGYTADEGLEALVVSVDGTTTRPDGQTFHITLSLTDGREARESNDVIERHGWIPLAKVFNVNTNVGWNPF